MAEAKSGWNRGSSQAASAPVGKQGKGKWVVLALVVVVICGIAAWFLVAPKGKVEVGKDREASKRIAEVKPAAAPKAVEEEKKPEIPYWEVDASQTNGFTREMVHKWLDKHRAPPGYRYKLNRKKSKWHIFDYKSENIIASLLCAKPGAAKIGRMRIDGRITEDFLESCKHPIIPTAEDDEFTKNLKRQMNQVKIELKERIDNGEDLAKIIEDTNDEMRKLAMFKMDLKKDLNKLIREGAKTKEDVEAFREAANKMLEAKGIAPLKFSDISTERLLNVKSEEDL